MGFFKTLITGYKLMYKDLTTKHNDLIPRCFSGCGTGLMMIGSAVMAKTATKEDVQKVIAEANAAVDEAKKSIEGEKKVEKTKRIFKARVVRGWKMVKAFKTGIAMEVGGAVMNGVGFKMEENGKHTALKAVGSLGAAFAAYRANVREELGDEADIRYMTGKKALKRKENSTNKASKDEDIVVNDDGVTIKKDPSDFKLWFSKETCPALWSSNYDLRKQNLICVEEVLTQQLMLNKHLDLNDMRREFAGKSSPKKFDVGVGGIFGRVWDDNKPLSEQRINLHFREDRDFIEGRTDSCWVIFDCDPDPIINKINKRPKHVEV